jgi:hypothetical protein
MRNEIAEVKALQSKLVQSKINSITTDIEIVIFSLAEIAGKVQGILVSEHKEVLHQDQEIDLGLLDIRVRKMMDELKDLSKKI